MPKIDERFNDLFDFELSNVEVEYAYFFDPDTKYDPIWKCTVILPEKVAAGMKEVGFNVREKTRESGEVVQYIVAKRKTISKKSGKAMPPPRVYGPDGKSRWNKDKLIGNGTVCNLQVQAQYKTVNGKMHLPLYLNNVQIVKYVEYVSSPFGDTTGDGEQEPAF